MQQLRTVGLFLKYCLFPGGFSFPGGFFSALGTLFGGISFVALVDYALKVGLADALKLVLGWYDKALEAVFGWLRQPIEWALERMLSFLSLDLHIYPHWKHALVLLNIYFIRNAFSYTRGQSVEKDWYAISVLMILGLILAPIVAGIAGLFEGQSFWQSIGVGLTPVLGIALYDLIERSWYVLGYSKPDAFAQFDLSRFAAYRFYIQRAFERLAISSSIVLACVAVIALSGAHVGNPGVIAFLAATFVGALYWVSGRSSLHYKYKGQYEREFPLLIRLMRSSGTTYLGMMMLGTFFWGIIFLLSSAGLQLFGL